jgi:hypothetical protein
MSVSMIFWGSMLCCALYVLVSWFAYKQHRLLLWLVWTIGGTAMLLASALVGAPPPKWVVWLWGWSWVVLPCWWLVRTLLRHREPPAPREDYSDLKPLTDERGDRSVPR